MIEFQQAPAKASDDKSLTSLIASERLAADERAALEAAVVTGNTRLGNRFRDYAMAEISFGVAIVAGLLSIPAHSDSLFVSALTYCGQVITVMCGFLTVPLFFITLEGRKRVKRQVAEAKALLAADTVDRT